MEQTERDLREQADWIREKSISRGSSDAMNSSSHWINVAELNIRDYRSVSDNHWSLKSCESLKDSVRGRFVYADAGYLDGER